MKFNKLAYLYSKPLGNHTLKIMKKIPGNLLKNLEKSWKYGILSVRKSGNPDTLSVEFFTDKAGAKISHTSLIQYKTQPTFYLLIRLK